MMMNESIYRLGEYRITEYENGLLRWEIHFNFAVQRSGKCYIFGDILIIGHWSNEGSGYLQLEFSELLQKLPIWEKTHYYCFASELKEYDDGYQSKREFLTKLNQLPKWDKSIVWCRSLVLRPCHVEVKQTENLGSTTPHQYIMEEHSFDEKPSALNLNQYEEPSKRLLRLSCKWIETAWHYIRRWKRWLKYLIPLILVWPLLGLVMIWYSIEKKSHSPHWGKDHHHEHDD